MGPTKVLLPPVTCLLTTLELLLKTVSHIVLLFCLLSAKCLLAVSVGKRVQVRIRDETHLFIYLLQLPGWLGRHAILYCRYMVIHSADTRGGGRVLCYPVPGRRWRQGTNAEFRQGTKSIKRLHFIALSFGSWSIQNNSEYPSSRRCPLSCLYCATDHQNNPNWGTATEDKSFKRIFCIGMENQYDYNFQ